MMRIRLRAPLAGPVIVIGASLILAACGGGEPTGTSVSPAHTASAASAVSPTATASATTAVSPAATASATTAVRPTATARAVTTGSPTATPVPAQATPTLSPTPVPTATPTITPESTATPTATPEPTPTPVFLRSVHEFEFILKLDKGAGVETAGWTELEPDALQGILSFISAGVDVILIWEPQQGLEPLTFLADTYNLLRDSQPDLTFDPIGEGEITVSNEAGIFGGFKTSDADGAVIGGGLIGAWVCSTAQRAYRLTLTGEDATLVQLRFDRFLDNFTCPS